MKKEETSKAPDEKVRDEQKRETDPPFTEVKNAHAAGLGALGRSDQKEEEEDPQTTY